MKIGRGLRCLGNDVVVATPTAEGEIGQVEGQSGEANLALQTALANGGLSSTILRPEGDLEEDRLVGTLRPVDLTSDST